MKLYAGLLAASLGFFAAAHPVAEVYILPYAVPARDASAAAPSLSPALARLILLQRLDATGHGPALRDLPEDADIDEAVSALNRFGKETPPLIKGGDEGRPSQLVVMLEGVTKKQMDDLSRTLGNRPAFSIPDPPSSSVHDDLVKMGFQTTGARDVGNCDMQQIANPLEECWNGQQSAFARFNVAKGSDIVDDLVPRLAQLSGLAKIGELETTLALLPSTTSPQSHSGQPQELRKRQAEQVSLDRTAPAPTSSGAEKAILYASSERILSCYNSEESCSAATQNCSGHGSCMDKYGNADGSSRGETCFACHCLSTRSESGSLTHWAGPTCAKQDISVAFWLFAGSSLALVTILWMAVSMLFNVGQQKLPGVIGAGVTRPR